MSDKIAINHVLFNHIIVDNKNSIEKEVVTAIENASWQLNCLSLVPGSYHELGIYRRSIRAAALGHTAFKCARRIAGEPNDFRKRCFDTSAIDSLNL